MVSVAGVAGFEPTNDGVRVRCLTAWRHPNMKLALEYFQRIFILPLSCKFIKRFSAFLTKKFLFGQKKFSSAALPSNMIMARGELC